MNISINVVLFVSVLSIALISVYLKISNKIDVFEPAANHYRDFDKKTRINKYINIIKTKPEDPQKMVFKESLFLATVVIVMFAIATNVIFFTAVVSNSMMPTYYRGDLLLMQNIDRTYRVGDIIMFRRPDTDLPYAHRIVSTTDEGIMTKGDATDLNDWWKLKNEDIIGKALLISGKPIVIKGYGNYFIISDKNQDFGPFGNDYRKYQLFFQVVKIYGYVIAALCLFLYIILTVRKKPSQN